MLPAEVMQLIGKTGEIMVLAVERGAIRKYADAIADANPLWLDEEYGRQTRHDSVIAPPGFFGWPTRWTSPMPFFSQLRQEIIDTIARSGYPNLLDGSIEYDLVRPVRAGDTLTAVQKVKDIYEKESAKGKMLFSVVETTYTNQFGDTVARTRQTIIHR